jgi:RNA polymerase sigma-70 factor (ECF subfamily)
MLIEVAPRIKGLFKAKLPRLQDAEDAFSETCLRLWRYTSQTKIDCFDAIAFTIARSIIAEFYRVKGRRVSEAVFDETYMEGHGSTKFEKDSIDKIDAQFLKIVIEELDEDEAQVILMRYNDQLSMKEIAETIGKTENATAVMVHRAINKLRKIAQEKFRTI